MRIALLAFIFMNVYFLSFSQTFIMNPAGNNTSVNTCSGIIVDQGGVSGDYLDNTNVTRTFCSADGGPLRIKIDFLNIEFGFDFLRIYDGPNTLSPQLANLTGFCEMTNDCPALVYTSSGSCLTLQFVSDGSITYDNWFYWGGFQAYIACDPEGCNGNPPAGDNCADATEICQLDGYCGTTNAWYTIDAAYTDVYVGNSQFCGSIENNSWLTFTAASSGVTIDVDVTNCFNSLGVQFVLFQGTCGSLTRVGSNCWSPLIGNNTLTFTGLTPGNSYFLMVDGYAGDICDYTVTAIAGIQTVNIVDAFGNVATAEMCPGECTTLSVNSTDPPTSYNWYSIPAGVSGTGSTVNICPTGDMTVFVEIGGVCGASFTASFDVAMTPINYSGLPPIATCDASPILLLADPEVTPCIYVVVSSNGQSSPAQTITLLEDGVDFWGPNTLSNVTGTINTFTYYQISPSAAHSLQLTGNILSDMLINVYDCSNNNLLYSGTWFDCGVVSCTQNVAVSTPGTVNGIAQFTSTCGGIVSLDWGAAIFDPNVVSGPYPVSCDITYNWNNEAGCSGNQTQTIIVGDNIPPTASNPAPINVACAGDVPAPNILVVIDEADNAGAPVVTFVGDATNGGTCPEIITRTYRVTDNCDNFIDVQQIITVGATVSVTMPANGMATVVCPGAIVNPVPPLVQDACGRPLVVAFNGSSAVPACEGAVVYNYTYTDCLGGTYPWIFTYNVDYTGALTPPANANSTVSCPANAVNPGAPANITDACGRTVVPVLVGQDGTTPACEGTVVWRYRYTACDGTTTADWTHTYTIDYSGGLTPPANTNSIVLCPADAVNPGAPVNITDACGRTVVPVLVGQDGATPACEGTVVWRYRFTACDGTTTADWTHTYTIDFTGALIPPANTNSTVLCPADAVNPGAPANIMDACGRTVIPALVGQDGPTPACEGTVVWRYRYTACDGTTTADWTHTYTIDYTGALTPPANTNSTVSCPADAVNPGAPANITDACGRTVVPVLVGQDGSTPACEGTVVWRYRYTACDGTTTVDWIHTYTIDLTSGPSEVGGPVASSSTVNCSSDAISPAVLPVIEDACGNTLSPLSGSPAIGGTYVDCEGTITYTYNYEDCAGNTFAWTYTYTIDIPVFTIGVANGSETVACPSDATDPGAPGVVTDACGNTLTPVITAPSAVGCTGGTMDWVYTYTDCAGNSAAWTYSYTVSMTAFTLPFANAGSTVNCLSAAQVQPIPPAQVFDACGNEIVPTFVAPVDIACEGTMAWVFNYEDCAGNTASWTYTYTIDIPTFVIATPNGSSIVNCLADAQVQPTAPAVQDACGNTLTPTVVPPAAIACEGVMVWTFNYTDCANNTASWIYTYTIDVPAFTISEPNGSATVNCLADAQVQPTAPAVQDACGNTLTPTVVVPADIACEGNMVWTFNYADCAGNSASWTHTYTIDIPTFVIVTPNGSSTVNCLVDAQVQPTAPIVEDACGNTLTPTVVPPAAIACEGVMVWTFNYSDCANNTASWTYTYTIDIPVFTIGVANGSETVACPSDATDPGAPGVVTDACGNTLTPVITAPSAVGCTGGTMDWVYTYTDCAGNSAAWTYSYTVSMTAFTLPFANAGSTVNCLSAAQVQPIPPAQVFDACGNEIVPTFLAPVDIACEGTMAWVFNYEDCAGNTASWTYTYTIDIPTFVIATPNGSSTVNCLADAQVQPTAPAVQDACGNTLTPTVVPPAAIACEGDMVWTFNYTDCANNTASWTYTYTIDIPAFTIAEANGSSTVNCLADAQVQPTAPAVQDACGNTLTPTVVPPAAIACEGDMVWTFNYADCAGNSASWTHTYTIDIPTFVIATPNGSSTVNCLADAQVQPTAPIVEDACGNTLTPTVVPPAAIACEGDMVWTFNYSDCANNTASWTYTYTIDIPAFTISYADGSETVACPADATDPGVPGVVTDACGNTLTPAITAPSAVGCTGGTMDWVYTYTDCAGNSATWTYSYTVTLTPFTIAEPSGSSTVNCLADAQVQPTPPTVQDACGNPIVPTVVAPTAIACEGDMEWTFNYEDCGGNTDSWTYTYTIAIPTFTISEPNGSSTVNCLADAQVQPTAPAVQDACGNTLTPAVVVPVDVTCEGDMEWIFNYADCAGNLLSWKYTYSVDAPFLNVPADITVSVSCIDEVVTPLGTTITDACGNTVVPVMTEGPDPVCSGQKIYTFTYANCAGETANCLYIFDVNDNISPEALALDTIYLQANDPVPSANIGLVQATDNCSSTPVVTFIGDVSDNQKCPETIARTYRVTDDCGNFVDVLQYIVINTGCDIVIPTAFTPNGDGMNDLWELVDIDLVYPNNKVFIYNRWGNLLFESEQGDYSSNQWDGKYGGDLLPVASYYYIIMTEGDNSGEILKGTVSIILK